MAVTAAAATSSLALLFASFPGLTPLKIPATIRILRPLTTFLSHRITSNSKSRRNPSPSLASASSSVSKSSNSKRSRESLESLKRRTRSGKEFDEECLKRHGDEGSHLPVLLGEVMDVFKSESLRSFVDCTLGAAGHSSAIVRAHPELELYIGLDVDPNAHEKAQPRMNDLVIGGGSHLPTNLNLHMVARNFKEIKQVIAEVDERFLIFGIDGILLDLGMSSMQVDDPERGFSMLNNGPLDMRMDPKATTSAEDILNAWPADEVGRILRDYGEERNWYYIQSKLMKARLAGGLHSTGELVDLIRSTARGIRGGRQGWIKTSARVFQALRIAVNDELRTLEASLHACFGCLAPGGRLAVISFHSLEDRIVKQTFLDLISNNKSHEDDRKDCSLEPRNSCRPNFQLEPWVKQIVAGENGVVLTKRPMTASLEEEKVNPRSRSAKLRVIQKT